MNCREFDALLPEPTSQALEHAASCERCGRLLAVWRGEFDLQEEGEAAGVVGAVLRRTTGRVCEAAEERLPLWVDGLLAGADEALVAGHVAHCAGCRALADALLVLRAELSGFAEVDPGPAFTEAVLQRTSRAAPVASRRIGLWAWGVAPADGGRPAGTGRLDRWLAAAGRTWSAVMHRPRAAWELAYGLSIVICLIVGSPAARVREVSAEVAALATRVAPPAVNVAAVVPEDWWGTTTGALQGTADEAKSRVPAGFLARLTRAWNRLVSIYRAVADHGPIMSRALFRLDLVGMWKEAAAIRLAAVKGTEPATPDVRPDGDRGMGSPGEPSAGSAADRRGAS